MKMSRFAAAMLLAASAAAHAEPSSVTLYGVIDEYVDRMHSSSGTHVIALEDGAWLRSRIGFKGSEDGGWRPAGSGGLKSNFTNPADVNGRTIDGVQFGVVHRF